MLKVTTRSNQTRGLADNNRNYLGERLRPKSDLETLSIKNGGGGGRQCNAKTNLSTRKQVCRADYTCDEIMDIMRKCLQHFTLSRNHKIRQTWQRQRRAPDITPNCFVLGFNSYGLIYVSFVTAPCLLLHIRRRSKLTVTNMAFDMPTSLAMSQPMEMIGFLKNEWKCLQRLTQTVLLTC